MSKKIEKLKKDGRGKNGGARPGSGRKMKEETPIIQELKTLIDNHGKDEIELKAPGGKVIKKARVLILLDKLFVDGLKGSIPAAKEYLDRVLGRAVQPISGEKDRPLEIRVIDVDPTIAKKYEINPSTTHHSGGHAPLPGGQLWPALREDDPGR